MNTFSKTCSSWYNILSTALVYVSQIYYEISIVVLRIDSFARFSYILYQVISKAHHFQFSRNKQWMKIGFLMITLILFDDYGI